MPLKEWQRVIDVNLNGVFWVLEALRIFRDQKSKGQSLICPPFTKIPWPTFAHYAASKGATEMFTKTIALEYAEYGIRANCIAPGAINTPINAEKFSDPEQLKQTTSMVPMGIIGKPNQVALRPLG